ncbi:MAG: GTP-binding protein [Thermoplasmata archaeon]|nr:MAG: GTP-binding protein [Thermoplasmata archaeon]
MAKVKVVMKKMCVIGEAAVGKTSLIRRFVLDTFSDRYIATIGSKTSAKKMKITTKEEEIILKLQIWDIIGLRSFAKVQKKAYKGANGAFFVMDKTRKGTWHSLGSWLLSLYKETGEIPVVVLANKNDLISEFEKSEIKNYVKRYGFQCYFTSAKTGENVNEAFHSLGELMVKPWEKKNIMPMLEKEEIKTMNGEPELHPGRSLSVSEVENIIMARYCDLFDEPEFAMSIINEQFRRAGLTHMDPSIQRLNKVVDFLMKAAVARIEPTRLDKEYKTYLSLIKKIEEQETIKHDEKA